METIVKAKLFHHNNLILQLIYNSHFDIYTINIHRENDNSDSDLFGLFQDLESATEKFNSIKL